MKNKQLYLTRASFAILAFVMLGYVVRFYPEQLVVFDQPIQSAIRGSLPNFLTSLFKSITLVGNTSTQVILVLAISAFLYFVKKWKVEAGLVALSGVLAGVLIVVLKNIYDRPRPSIEHLVHADGFSFPSGHSLGAFLIFGSLLIVLHQRLEKSWRKTVFEALLVLLIAFIGLSRIYLGVHYPTDVLAGFVMGYGVLNLLYPFYDQKRFEWRFQAKQK